jgi:sugar transferase EpsL
MNIMIKRMIDVFVTCIAFVILFPALVIVASIVSYKLGFPFLFVQTRPGLMGQPFKMYKFRTMTDACTADGHLLPDVDRLTSFGRWLRSTSIDELPALWNVVMGHMSLVGPRPLLMQYLPLYSPEQARRHEVRPGITGWAQVNGRNALSWEEKFALDVWYVDNFSLWLDFKILFSTAVKVIKKDGVNASNDVTMPLFHGSQRSSDT